MGGPDSRDSGETTAWETLLMCVCIVPQPMDVAAAPRVAVIGTGVAALSCARELAAHAVGHGDGAAFRGARVTLFTTRSKMTTQMGPRNQTIPQPDKPFFDYAVQYITATDPWFCEEVGRWTALGLCQPLPPGEVGVASAAGGYRPLPQDVPCYVGNGGMWRLMSALTEQAAEQYAGALEHVSGFPDDRRAVVGLARRGQDGGWDLQLKGGQWLGPFDYVVGGFAQHCLTEPFLRRGGAACDKMLRCLRHIKYSQLFPVQVFPCARDVLERLTPARGRGGGACPDFIVGKIDLQKETLIWAIFGAFLPLLL